MEYSVFEINKLIKKEINDKKRQEELKNKYFSLILSSSIKLNKKI